MRAILLAAGMGTRLRPITYETPKSLIKIKDESLIERQIKFLREAGVEEIVVMTGYLNEKFNFLKEKYNVKLVNNDKYDVYNNIYSMYLVREYLSDAYVIDADTYLCRNYLEKAPKTSVYFSGNKVVNTEEWMLVFDENNRVQDIKISSGEGYVMSGVSYWTKDDGDFLKKKLEEIMDNNNWHNLYWDDIAKDNLKNIDVRIRKINGDDWFEIDSLEDLKNLNESI